MSIILKNTLQPDQTELVTCAAAVAVCRVIDRLTGKELKIKWVNDLFCNGKKCCGILTEAYMDIETGDLDHIIVGIGLNLYPPADGWPPELKDIAGSVLEPEEFTDRSRLTAEITNELLKIYSLLPRTEFIEEYKKRSFIIGKEIFIIQNNVRRPAIAKSVTDRGHLRVITPSGDEEELSCGEVSIKV